MEATLGQLRGRVPAQLPPKHLSGLRMPWLAVKACAIWRWMGRALVWPFSGWSWALVSWSRKAGWVVECLFCWHRDTPWVVFALRIGTGYWIFGNSIKFRTFSGGILKVLSLWDTGRWKIGGQHFLGFVIDYLADGPPMENGHELGWWQFEELNSLRSQEKLICSTEWWTQMSTPDVVRQCKNPWKQIMKIQKSQVFSAVFQQQFRYVLHISSHLHGWGALFARSIRSVLMDCQMNRYQSDEAGRETFQAGFDVEDVCKNHQETSRNNRVDYLITSSA